MVDVPGDFWGLSRGKTKGLHIKDVVLIPTLRQNKRVFCEKACVKVVIIVKDSN